MQVEEIFRVLNFSLCTPLVATENKAQTIIFIYSQNNVFLYPPTPLLFWAPTCFFLTVGTPAGTLMIRELLDSVLMLELPVMVIISFGAGVLESVMS